MCEPTTIAAVATGMNVASTITGQRAAEKRYAQAQDAARVQGQANIGMVDLRLGQERVATAQRADELSLQAQAMRGSVATSAAAGGVTGLSISELGDEVTGQEARSRSALMTSLGWKEQQAQAEKRAIAAGARAQALQYMPTTTMGGGLLAAGISGLGLYGQAQALTPRGGTGQVNYGAPIQGPPMAGGGFFSGG